MAVVTAVTAAVTAGDVTGGGGGGSSREVSSRGSGFPLPLSHLLVALSLVEEAVLEEGGSCSGGGEAAAGLLRAFRTARNASNTSNSSNTGEGGRGSGSGVRGVGIGGVSERGGDQALGGGGCGHAEGGEVSEFAALLDQVRQFSSGLVHVGCSDLCKPCRSNFLWVWIA